MGFPNNTRVESSCPFDECIRGTGRLKLASDELAKNKKEILSDTGNLGLDDYKSPETENKICFLDHFSVSN